MSETTKIKIIKLGRKQQPSKYKEGDTYAMTTILDEISGRKGTTFGKWAENWKVGDEVEGIWEKKLWKDKDGFEQDSWTIANPNKTTYGGGFAKKPIIVDAYLIAAQLAPVLLTGKKNITFDDITLLANKVKEKLDVVTPTSDKLVEKPAEKEIDVDKDDDFEVDSSTDENPF